jgi:hypothetical protein
LSRKSLDTWKFGLKILSQGFNHRSAPALFPLLFINYPSDIPIK